MTAIVAAALMWALVIILLFFRRRRSSRTVTYSAVAIALSMTLNIDTLYVPFDRFLGGTNWGDLLANIALMVGIFFLGRGVTAAYDFSNIVTRLALGRGVLTVALAGVVISFMLVDHAHTSTQFMLDFGSQPAAAVYSILQYVYYGVVVGAMGWICLDQQRSATGSLRASVTSLAAGSGLAIIACAVVITMDLAHVTGELALMNVMRLFYGPSYVGAIALLCFGLALPPAARWTRNTARLQVTKRYIKLLTPSWEAAAAQRPTATRLGSITRQAENPEQLLHRQVVEIRDATIDPRSGFALDERAATIIDRAEAHLLAGDRVRAPRARTVRPVT